MNDNDVVIDTVEKECRFAKSLKPNDVILAVNNIHVRDKDHFFNLINGKNQYTLIIERGSFGDSREELDETKPKVEMEPRQTGFKMTASNFEHSHSTKTAAMTMVDKKQHPLPTSSYPSATCNEIKFEGRAFPLSWLTDRNVGSSYFVSDVFMPGGMKDLGIKLSMEGGRVVVVHVRPQSLGANAFRVNDTFLALNGEKVRGIEGCIEAMQKSEKIRVIFERPRGWKQEQMPVAMEEHLSYWPRKAKLSPAIQPMTSLAHVSAARVTIKKISYDDKHFPLKWLKQRAMGADYLFITYAGSVDRQTLGIQHEVRDDFVTVTNVAKDSLGYGIFKCEDRILAVNGTKVVDEGEFNRLIFESKTKTTFIIERQRDLFTAGDKKQVLHTQNQLLLKPAVVQPSIRIEKVGTREDQYFRDIILQRKGDCIYLNMTINPAQDSRPLGLGINLIHGTVTVTEIVPGSIAADGFQLNDRILAVNGIQMKDAEYCCSLIQQVNNNFHALVERKVVTDRTEQSVLGGAEPEAYMVATETQVRWITEDEARASLRKAPNDIRDILLNKALNVRKVYEEMISGNRPAITSKPTTASVTPLKFLDVETQVITSDVPPGKRLRPSPY
ncbi:unnamed protein product [Soboliphyme baturini]|uniref:PDZ domain-containing protein n=1 Tax=Soboliphyme baturini TaxID=241478 RepID=A0A183J4E6_9BILA|nr:unnamed protein product [Soboliphyme baturini]